ncbi:MAG: hypothetical protein KJ749_13560 [Planctomycetes bacterium]|nr:hypothetical protein [Planctomycetota bacterium]
MIRRPSRVRRVLKWIGLSLSLSMLVLWSINVAWGIKYESTSKWYVALIHGRIIYQANYPRPASGGWLCNYYWPNRMEVLAEEGFLEFLYEALGFSLPGPFAPGCYRVPIWLVLVLVGVPTAILWWRDRRPPPGFCQSCGYDLTGNVSGICSECGTRLDAA